MIKDAECFSEEDRILKERVDASKSPRELPIDDEEHNRIQRETLDEQELNKKFMV